MERYKYDLHIHSCLSPCGDNDMTPNNMVNMAAILGCDIMAVTDHNDSRNVPAAVKVGEEVGVLVVPGMELCTSEEAHVVCLFDSVEGCLEFQKYVYSQTPDIKNRPDIFGEQLILDENDECIGHEERLLLSSSFISVNDVLELARSYGGTAFPAHVNADSYSVIASLGAIPDEAGFSCCEVTRECDIEQLKMLNPEVAEKKIFTDSDAHYLHLMTDDMNWIELPEKSLSALIAFIDGRGEGRLEPFRQRDRIG